VGNAGPAFLASRTDEKKGKSGSTHAPQGVAGTGGFCCGAARSPPTAAASASDKIRVRREFTGGY
jgi:hypothetical protein